MTRSFSYLCISITNAICLTGLWILIAVFPDLFAGIESLTTILKSLIWLGFIMDTLHSFVCFAEFLVVRLKVQVPGQVPLVYHFLLVICSSLLDYLTETVDSISDTWQITTAPLASFLFCRIFMIYNIYMNKQTSNVVHGINNPVAYPVGPIGRQAMAGA